MSEIVYTRGGLSVDDRGELLFINDFSLQKYKRFYVVSNHQPQFIRAWHGHKYESKGVVLLSGSAIVCAVKIDDWEHPSSDLPIHRQVLSAKTPGVLEIPKGYANGFMTLEPNTVVCFFSSSSLEESANDDIRFPATTWNPWSVEER